MVHPSDNQSESLDLPKEPLSEIARIDQFYHEPHGRMLGSFLRSAIQPHLQLDLQIDRLGFGYPFMCLPSITMPVLVPSEMGALAYGHGDEVMTASVLSNAWPIASDSMNQIIICHGLEFCHDGTACLSEANRVLASSGELVLMTPNRRSFWVRDETTPLGHGRPFSKGQITKLLTKTGFTMTHLSRAVFLPPMGLRAPYRMAKAWNHIGQFGWGLFGGVMIIKATKLRYAKKPKGRDAVMVSLSGALRPVSRPASQPAAPLSSQLSNQCLSYPVKKSTRP